MSNRKSSERTPAPPLAVLIGQTAAKAPSGKTTEPAQSPYLAIFLASPLERIAMIKQGVPAQAAKQLFAVLDIGQGAGFAALNLSPATVNKKAKQGAALSPEESERVIGCARLVGQLEAMVQESGDPKNFDAAAWIARWLTEPLPAFAGTRPADLMDTMEGQALVSSTLAKLQSGAYA
jgi:putative toxin-antitoxin system antitoxin component (TIGR02293 family)